MAKPNRVPFPVLSPDASTIWPAMGHNIAHALNSGCIHRLGALRAKDAGNSAHK